MSDGGRKSRSRVPSGFLTGRNGDLIAALDIGSAKIGCLIARIDPEQSDNLILLGGGQQSSRGFDAGSITDMSALERAVRLAVEDAEQQAGEAVSDVIVGVSAPQVSGRLVRGETEIGGREVTERDVRKVLSEAMERFSTSPEAEKDLKVLSATPIAYAVDDAEGVRSPIGMCTHRLGVLVNVIHVPGTVARNLVQTVARARLHIAAMVPSTTASGLGALVEDERENGAICIDMGARVTGLSVYLHGVPAWFSRIPVGGAHVTRDIAQGLGTTVAAAERVKTVHGSAIIGGPGSGARIECPRLGDDGRLTASEITRQDLARLIAPRLEETFELVAQRLNASPLRAVLPRRIVLTGGASQLKDVRELASRALGAPVRLARPAEAAKIGETLATPAFSTAVGLLTYPLAGLYDAGRGGVVSNSKGSRNGSSLIGRTYGWIRENF